MTAPPDLLDDLVADGFAVRTIAVEVAGDGAGAGPLTWAQADHWRGIAKTGQAATLSGSYQFPPGSTLDEQVELLRFVVSRHPALRTRLTLTAGGWPRQVCSATGQVTLWVIEAGDAHPPTVAHQVRELLSARPFDYQHEFPIRLAAVLMPDGTVSQQVVVYLHLAVDAGGLSALLADLADRDPVTGAPAGPITAVQPLELAVKQASPAGQKQSAASLRHLERVLRTAEPALLGQPSEGPAEHQAFRYRSPATALALTRIVQAQRVPAPSALLALFAMSLARERGVDPVWTMVLVSNRFRPGLADSVSQLVQSSPFVLELAGCSFAEALARAQQGLLQTYKHAYYDGGQQNELIERIEWERGYPIQLGCYFNDRQDERAPSRPAEPASDEELRQALARSDWLDEGGPLPDVGLFVNVDHRPDALEFPVSFDTRYLNREAAAQIVRGIETLAVRAAIAPDRPVLELDRA